MEVTSPSQDTWQRVGWQKYGETFPLSLSSPPELDYRMHIRKLPFLIVVHDVQSPALVVCAVGSTGDLSWEKKKTRSTNSGIIGL